MQHEVDGAPSDRNDDADEQGLPLPNSTRLKANAGASATTLTGRAMPCARRADSIIERNGAVVRLSDVAKVELGAEEAETVAKYGKKEAVYLGVWPLIGENEIDVAHRLREEMKRIRPTRPQDIDMQMAFDSVGLITLVGLVAKNGILIVQFANTLQEPCASKLVALREASLTRLRPVLMTSVATVFGHLPLVFVSGPGSEARNSIGIVLVAGMTIGTLFTLFVVPVLYSLLATQHEPEDAMAPSAPLVA